MKPEQELFQVELLLPGGETHSILVAGEEHIWNAAFKAGIVLPALCHQGYCLTCAGRLEGQGESTNPIRWSTFP
jgi:ferredoxin